MYVLDDEYEEIKKEIKQVLELYKNESTAYRETT